MGLTQVKTTGIADDAITSAKIADDAVVAAAIADDAVVTAAIADDAVTGANIADDTVAEANMANDAISLTELKAGTDGQIITWDASGNPTAVGPGTDGQVLTSTGSGSPPAFETISSSDTLPFRNLAINGAMNVNQRGNFTGITSGQYGGPDRIKFDYGGLGTWSISQTADAPDNTGFKNCYHLACTTADGSVGAGEMLAIQHIMENSNLHRMEAGTSDAKTWAIQFWIKSNKTGTYMAELYRLAQGGTARQISQTFTISSADTWEKKTMTFAGDTNAGGVMSDDNNAGMQFNIWFAAGSNFTSGSLNTSWNNVTAANRMPGLSNNLADSTSNYLKFTGLQIEEGSTHTSFEHKSYGDELAASQRYFWMAAYGNEAAAGNGGSGLSPICTAAQHTTTEAYGVVRFPCRMRAAPSIYKVEASDYWAVFLNQTCDSCDTISINRCSTTAATIGVSGNLSTTEDQACWIATFSSSARLGFQAEL